jgi:alpha-L-fucosidase
MNIWKGPWGWSPNVEVLSYEYLIHMLANVVCRGGNWLVNVGPDRNGRVPEAAVTRMREIGQWLQRNGEAVYGTRGGPAEPEDGVFGTTCRDNKIYVHILNQQAFKAVPLKDGVVQSCSLLSGEEIPFSQRNGIVSFQLPSGHENEPDLIIKLVVVH